MLKEGTILHPGDEVAIKGPYGNVYTLGIVAKVTPSGQIILTNGNRYNQRGYKKGDSWTRSSLDVLTPEIRAKIIHDEYIEYLKSIDWQKVDDTTLAQVVAIIKKEE